MMKDKIPYKKVVAFVRHNTGFMDRENRLTRKQVKTICDEVIGGCNHDKAAFLKSCGLPVYEEYKA